MKVGGRVIPWNCSDTPSAPPVLHLCHSSNILSTPVAPVFTAVIHSFQLSTSSLNMVPSCDAAAVTRQRLCCVRGGGAGQRPRGAYVCFRNPIHRVAIQQYCSSNASDPTTQALHTPLDYNSYIELKASPVCENINIQVSLSPLPIFRF